MEFIYAWELKKKFNVFGHFYNLVMGEETFPCRSMLEIISKDKEYPTSSYVDAIIIMMNPGSSRPLDINYKPHSYNVNMIFSEDWSKEIVVTRPDNAQYQIMRLMVNQDWEFVRILNLSDIRNGNSGNFFQYFSRSFLIDNSNPHSIFNKNRVKELNKNLKTKNDAPIILAWGTETFLFPIAEKAMNVLSNYSFIGVNYGLPNLCYRHPSPYKKTGKLSWLIEINLGIEKNNFKKKKDQENIFISSK